MVPSDSIQKKRFSRIKSFFAKNWKLILAITGGAFIIVVAILLVVLSQDLPSLSQLEEIEPELATKIYSADGKVIKELFVKKRIFVPLNQLPTDMYQAVLATEDHRFYSHWGVAPTRLARVILIDIATLSKSQGASTLTQQLARQLFLTLEKTITRKIKEILTAIQIERAYTKREILEMYLNHMYFGHGTYGVEAASQYYFNKSARELHIEECALLTGLLQRPNSYSPYRFPRAALQRRNVVLYRMKDVGYINRAQFDSLKQIPIQTYKRTPEDEFGIAPYFTEEIRQRLQKKYGWDLYKGGLSVYTTLDTRVQACAEKAIRDHIPDLERKIRERWRRPNNFRDIIGRRVSDNELHQLMSDPAVVDSIITKKVVLQVSFMAVNPANGHVLALVGGRDFAESKFNRVFQSERQPGSAFKPFVYTAAVDNGYMPSYEVLNQPVVVFMADGTRWVPRNYDLSIGGLTTLREGLRRSLNLISARLVQEKVPARIVKNYAHNLGLNTQIDPVDAIALGACEVKLAEMVSAYSAFANRGVRVDPILILRVEDKFGNILENNVSVPHEVLREETAYIMTSLMSTVIDRGTGAGARSRYNFRRPAAGKTGTTNNYTDAWFVGFTPQISAGVWVGFDDQRVTLGSGQDGARTALPVWAPFMRMAHDTLNLPIANFYKPDGVVTLEICNETKKLANEFCPEIITEIFDRRYMPTEYCDKHINISDQNTSKSSVNKGKRRIKF